MAGDEGGVGDGEGRLEGRGPSSQALVADVEAGLETHNESTNQFYYTVFHTV